MDPQEIIDTYLDDISNYTNQVIDHIYNEVKGYNSSFEVVEMINDGNIYEIHIEPANPANLWDILGESGYNYKDNIKALFKLRYPDVLFSINIIKEQIILIFLMPSNNEINYRNLLELNFFDLMKVKDLPEYKYIYDLNKFQKEYHALHKNEYPQAPEEEVIGQYLYSTTFTNSIIAIITFVDKKNNIIHVYNDYYNVLDRTFSTIRLRGAYKWAITLGPTPTTIKMMEESGKTKIYKRNKAGEYNEVYLTGYNKQGKGRYKLKYTGTNVSIRKNYVFIKELPKLNSFSEDQLTIDPG